MAGNVWQWCADWYDNQYYQQSPRKNPTGPDTGTARVLRGGSWYYTYPRYLRVTYRFGSDPGSRFGFYGFRCMRLSPGQ